MPNATHLNFIIIVAAAILTQLAVIATDVQLDTTATTAFTTVAMAILLQL